MRPTRTHRTPFRRLVPSRYRRRYEHAISRWTDTPALRVTDVIPQNDSLDQPLEISGVRVNRITEQDGRLPRHSIHTPRAKGCHSAPASGSIPRHSGRLGSAEFICSPESTELGQDASRCRSPGSPARSNKRTPPGSPCPCGPSHCPGPPGTKPRRHPARDHRTTTKQFLCMSLHPSKFGSYEPTLAGLNMTRPVTVPVDSPRHPANTGSVASEIALKTRFRHLTFR